MLAWVHFKMLMHKSFFARAIFYFVAFATLSGWTNTKGNNIETHIGLYQIIDSKCEAVSDDFDPCESSLFFELLKGQFIGVEDNELAYVIWSGDPKIDSELQYTSHLVRNHDLRSITGNRFILVDDDDSQEYLLFSDGKLTAYHVVYATGNGSQHRAMHYKLKPVQRGNLPHVRLNYPGNK